MSRSTMSSATLTVFAREFQEIVHSAQCLEDTGLYFADSKEIARLQEIVDALRTITMDDENVPENIHVDGGGFIFSYRRDTLWDAVSLCEYASTLLAHHAENGPRHAVEGVERRCVFLGRMDQYDLYVFPHQHDPRLIAVQPDGDYHEATVALAAMITVEHTDVGLPALREAYRIAESRGWF